jgi:hypothetical protein
MVVRDVRSTFLQCQSTRDQDQAISKLKQMTDLFHYQEKSQCLRPVDLRNLNLMQANILSVLREVRSVVAL